MYYKTYLHLYGATKFDMVTCMGRIMFLKGNARSIFHGGSAPRCLDLIHILTRYDTQPASFVQGLNWMSGELLQALVKNFCETDIDA